MKKYFIIILLLFVGLALVSCDKGKDQNNAENPLENPQTNPQDSTESNPYPYLRLQDLSSLHLITLSQAEAILKEMGFSDKDEKYIYTSSDKKERIVGGLNSDGLVEGLSYVASKGIAPNDAKKWLIHISENVTLPKYKRSIPFAGAYFYDRVEEDPKIEEEPKYIAKTYSQYIGLLENLASGMRVEVFWEEDNIPEDESVGYSVAIIYRYGNNIDQAILSIASLHRIEPVEPEMAE